MDLGQQQPDSSAAAQLAKELLEQLKTAQIFIGCNMCVMCACVVPAESWELATLAPAYAKR